MAEAPLSELPPETDPHHEGCDCSQCKKWFQFMNHVVGLTGRCRNCGRPLDEFHDWVGDKMIRCQRLRE